MIKSAGYSLTDYGDMILDKIRMSAYAEALRRHVKPGMVVADLGAGSGVFSLLACQLGAARVYAIEPDPAILVARESAAENGYADRMVCIEGMSTETELPERVDLIVSDMRGTLPLLAFHLPAIIDARKRLLKPDGLLIPRRDTMRCAPVEAPDAYARMEKPWRHNDYDLDLGAARRYIARSYWRARIEASQMLADAADWATLDYATVDSPDVDGEMEWTIARSGTLHGFCAWFDAEPCEGIAYSNAPGLPETVYGHGFFPLPEPVQAIAGDRVQLRLRANLIRGDYLYRWDARVSTAEGGVRMECRQSSHGALPVSRDELSRRAEDYRPQLGEKGRIDRLVLDGMARSLPLQDIALELANAFPARFPDRRRALDAVADMSVKYAE